MEVVRKPFQGVVNIIRFNWHYYIMAIGVISVLLVLFKLMNPGFQLYLILFIISILLTTSVSLAVSFYIYDVSDLYKLTWIDDNCNSHHLKILNINAGFDETSALLKQKLPMAELTVLDFYDPAKHTEISIKRARKVYPPYPNTVAASTENLPFVDNSFERSFAILSAHEIREEKERIAFFQEVGRVTTLEGQILVTEHIRDFANFMAYSFGCFHFHSQTTWERTFSKAGLLIQKKIKTTPFITTFILAKNGNTL